MIIYEVKQIKNNKKSKVNDASVSIVESTGVEIFAVWPLNYIQNN
jgi:hypothetical protein